MILRRNQYEIVEKNLRVYFKLKKYIEDREDIIINSTVIADDYMPTNSSARETRYTDTTSDKAINLTNDKELIVTKKWVQAIDNTLKRFKGTKEEDFIKARYFENLSKEEVMDKILIENTTFYKYRENIVIYTTIQAVQLGLMVIR